MYFLKTLKFVSLGLALTAMAASLAHVTNPAAAQSGQIAALTDKIGDVSRHKGKVSALAQDARRILTTGSNVIYQDRIQTGGKSRAEIKLLDDSVITLGDHSDLIIDELVFNPGGESRGNFRLTKGVFRMVSGRVNKVPGGTLTMTTPVATIGIRGTDFWGLQEPGKLTMVLIDDGVLDISNGNETVTLSQPLSGVIIEEGIPGIQLIRITPQELAAAAQTIGF